MQRLVEERNAKLYGGSVVLASWLAVFCLFGYRATFASLKGLMGISPSRTDILWPRTFTPSP